ncbi:MAG: endonuclease III [Bacillota bacterium]
MERLVAHYPQVKSGLVFKSSYQLFVATVLSAQTTDGQVNRITRALFKAAPDIYTLSKMEPLQLEEYVKSCGLYRQKSKSLIAAARIIVKEYSGRIPENFDQLIGLPGVGRKTANVIISSAFDQPALAVDTHVFRVSRRLGLAEATTVELVEEQLKEVIPRECWSESHHRLIAHGRSICHARKPDCEACFLTDLCPYYKKGGEL